MKPNAQPIRVLIVDDHFVVRVGLAAMIETQKDMTVVAKAENGNEAIALYEQHQPDVVVMDLRLPGMSGLEATVAIRERHPAARIVVLTTYDGDEDIYRALEAGAMAYLLKDSLHSELLDIIRRVHVGERYIPDAVAQRLAERVARVKLTPREIEILERIAKGMSNREIATGLSIAEATVNVHVSNITTKLGVNNRTQVIIAAHKRGIIHIE
jgi:two-component system, NarL family, response regulator